MESTKIEGRRQYMIGGKKYPFELTLKELRLEKIWTL